MPDDWTPYQVDSLVVWFGLRVENMMSELDERGNRVHSLSAILMEDGEEFSEEENKAAVMSLLGASFHGTPLNTIASYRRAKDE